MDAQYDYDVVIVGAGIGGICSAYRLQERCPQLTFCVLEGRHEVGGTWSLFQYPGIRSDSDLYTYSFPWKPWHGKSIASGAQILQYLKAAAREHGLDKHIKFHRQVDNMSWSTATSTWTVDATDTSASDTAAKTERLRCRFMLLSTGYYDYETPLQARIPGLADFEGPVVHPQFWPKGLDFQGKNVVVVGSGATAITLVPTLARRGAAHVTMLQRSPTYIASVPGESAVHSLTKLMLPRDLASRVIRWQWILFMLLFVRFCRLFPRLAWAVLLLRTRTELALHQSIEPDFTPRYEPFDQNLCLTPDSDFYEMLRKGRTSITTGHIDRVTPTRIKLQTGPALRPDIIVTATGLKVRFGGGIRIAVDDEPFAVSEHFVWKGCMLDSLPNCVAIIGYYDASWTLGTDISAKMACRLINRAMRGKKKTMVARTREGMKTVPIMYLNSTYVTSADSSHIPKAGDQPQWQPRKSYWHDTRSVWWGDISTDVEWS
ncbi:FAD dependent oxidoreductase [Cordyceps militaris]|uniref:FAD dependent oxidoreductase n=1 Tax=Cordyceps militaris TaxID=73501 RepID=A0A2H4S8C3_CORMI|nr:FAD dependent oxidoreductase [Cordyceps militaris]